MSTLVKRILEGNLAVEVVAHEGWVVLLHRHMESPWQESLCDIQPQAEDARLDCSIMCRTTSAAGRTDSKAKPNELSQKTAEF